MSSGDDIKLLIRAAKAGDNTAAERLVRENSGLIWSVARRFFGRGVEADDLYQLGCVGFVKAVTGYDESFGTQFSTYAVPKISGEIRRFLRDDGAIKVSRGLKERALLIRRERERLRSQLGREPLLSELTESIGLSAEDIASADIAIETPDSLQRENGAFTLENAFSGESMEEGIVEQVSLKEAVEALPERERILVILRFFKGLTQERTAKILGVSQVQVSRLEKRALGELRARISGG